MTSMVHILGGGTLNHVRAHFALAAPAFGGTARTLYGMIPEQDRERVVLHLTKMADYQSNIITNEDVSTLLDKLISDPTTKFIIQNMALCDFEGSIGDVESGKYAERLKTREGDQTLTLTPAKKLIGKIKGARPDIFVVGFKTTTNATVEDQIKVGRRLLGETRSDMVLANDLTTRTNILITQTSTHYDSRDNLYKEIINTVLV